MTGNRLLRRRIWIVAALAVTLIAVHGITLFYASSRLVLSAGFVSGLILLIVIKHLGLLGPVYALFRSRVISGREKQSGKG